MASSIQPLRRARLLHRWHEGHHAIEVALDDLRTWVYCQKHGGVPWDESTQKLRDIRDEVAEFFRTEAWLCSATGCDGTGLADDVLAAAEVHARQAAVDRYNLLSRLDSLIAQIELPAAAELRQLNLDAVDEFIDHLERHMNCESESLLWFNNNRAMT